MLEIHWKKLLVKNNISVGRCTQRCRRLIAQCDISVKIIFTSTNFLTLWPWHLFRPWKCLSQGQSWFEITCDLVTLCPVKVVTSAGRTASYLLALCRIGGWFFSGSLLIFTIDNTTQGFRKRLWSFGKLGVQILIKNFSIGFWGLALSPFFLQLGCSESGLALI